MLVNKKLRLNLLLKVGDIKQTKDATCELKTPGHVFMCKIDGTGTETETKT